MTGRQYWSLLREFTICGFKLRDQGSLLGFLWTLLHPLMLLLVLYMLFQDRLGSSIEHFRIYVLIGIIHWSFFATATTKTVNSIAMRREVVGNIYFPREILVFSDVGTVLISFVLELLVLFVFMVAEGIPFQATWFLLPLSILLQSLFIIGIGLLLATLQIYVRDIERIWTIVLRIGFFLVPIFYDPMVIKSDVQRTIYLCNPLTQIMIFSRSLLIDGRVPDGLWTLYTVAVGILLAAAALVFFKKMEPSFAERC
jgi:ABC-type polysaccharide/polyol phosphate export permease